MAAAYPRIIAHRCGGVLAPENTLAGLDAAARQGCRAVEFDVMLTADGVPILMHDDTLDRTTPMRGDVALTSFAQLRVAAPAVPTLAEAIARCQQYGFWCNIELKPTPGREEETGSVVGTWLAAHWNGHGVISSFAEKSTLTARSVLPAARYAMLWERLPDDWQAVCASLGASAVHLDASQMTAADVQRLNAAAMTWACYTVNQRAAADALFAQGCAAVFTDQPGLWGCD